MLDENFFIVDTERDEENNPKPVDVQYDVNFELLENFENDEQLETQEKPIELIRNSSSSNKRMLNGPRYHLADSDGTLKSKPGYISRDLRHALGLSETDIPLHIYKMRSLGYPPGWLRTARKDENVSFINNAESTEQPKHEIEYKREALIRYPGFNCSIDRYQYDEYELFNCPQYNPRYDHIEVFYEKLASKSKELIDLKKLQIERKRILKELEKIGYTDNVQVADLDEPLQKNQKILEIPNTIPSLENCTCTSEQNTSIHKDDEIVKEPELGLPAVPSSQLLQLLEASFASLDDERDTVIINDESVPLHRSESVKSLPDLNAFSKNVLPYKPYENLPESRGSYKKDSHVITSRFPDKHKRRNGGIRSVTSEQLANILVEEESYSEPKIKQFLGVSSDDEDDIEWDNIQQVDAHKFMNEQYTSQDESIKVESAKKKLLDTGIEMIFAANQASSPIDSNSIFIKEKNDAEISNDADEEDIHDGRYKFLSEYGQTVAKNLKENSQKHREKRIECFVRRDLQCKEASMNPTPPNPTNIFFPKEILSTKKIPINDDPDYLTLFPTNIRVYRPLISYELWRQRCSDRNVMSLSAFIQKSLNVFDTNSLSTDNWILVGIIGSRTPLMESRAGNKYSTWKLTDLSSIGPGMKKMGSVTLFLFQKVHEQFWKTNEGSVVAILRPKIMNNKESGANNKKDPKEISIRVENHQFIMVIGESPDFAICSAKNISIGLECNRVVNKNITRYCELHVKQAYMAASSSRATFGISRSTLFGSNKLTTSKPTTDSQIIDNAWTNLNRTKNQYEFKNCSGSLNDEILKNDDKLSSEQTEEFIDKVIGKSTPGAMNLKQVLVTKNKPNQRINLKLDSKNSSSISFKDFFLMKKDEENKNSKMQNSTTNDFIDLGPISQSNVSIKNNNVIEINNTLKKPVVDHLRNANRPNKNLVKDLSTSSPIDKNNEIENKVKNVSKRKRTIPINLEDDLKLISNKKKIKLLHDLDNDDEITVKKVNSSDTEKLSRSNDLTDVRQSEDNSFAFKHKEEIFSRPNLMKNDEFTRWKAAAILKARGGLEESEKENKLKNINERLEKIVSNAKKRTKSSPLTMVLGPMEISKCELKSSSKVAEKLINNNDELIKEKIDHHEKLMKKLNEESNFSHLAEIAEIDEENRYLDHLVRKDQLEEQLLNMHEVECKIAICRTCDYRAPHISQQCREANHDVAYIKGFKRFFSCTRCHNRATTFHRYPKYPCTNCGGNSFEKAGSIAQRNGPKLLSETLSLRGIEEPFLS